MNSTLTSTARIAFAVAALAVALAGAASIATGFLPADPHVGEVRAQALLDRAERVRGMQAPAAVLRLAQVQVLVR